MKKSIICLFALSSIFSSAAVFADESGSGKPENSNNTQSASTTTATTTSAITATTDCSVFISWIGLCTAGSQSGDDSE